MGLGVGWCGCLLWALKWSWAPFGSLPVVLGVGWCQLFGVYAGVISLLKWLLKLLTRIWYQDRMETGKVLVTASRCLERWVDTQRISLGTLVRNFSSSQKNYGSVKMGSQDQPIQRAHFPRLVTSGRVRCGQRTTPASAAKHQKKALYDGNSDVLSFHSPCFQVQPRRLHSDLRNNWCHKAPQKTSKTSCVLFPPKLFWVAWLTNWVDSCWFFNV